MGSDSSNIKMDFPSVRRCHFEFEQRGEINRLKVDIRDISVALIGSVTISVLFSAFSVLLSSFLVNVILRSESLLLNTLFSLLVVVTIFCSAPRPIALFFPLLPFILTLILTLILIILMISHGLPAQFFVIRVDASMIHEVRSS